MMAKRRLVDRRTFVVASLTTATISFIVAFSPSSSSVVALDERVTSHSWWDFTQSRCPKICLDVIQGDRYYGQYSPVATHENVVDFFDLKDESFNGNAVVPTVPDHSLFFIHQDVRNCHDHNYINADDANLSFVVVHDSKEDATGGQVRMWIDGDRSNAAVQNGGRPTSFYLYMGRDSKQDDDPTKIDRTEMFWEWGRRNENHYRTAGMADYVKDRLKLELDGGLDSPRCLYVSAKFIHGIKAWRYVPGSMDANMEAVDPNGYLYLDMNRPLYICRAKSCGMRPGHDPQPPRPTTGSSTSSGVGASKEDVQKSVSPDIKVEDENGIRSNDLGTLANSYDNNGRFNMDTVSVVYLSSLMVLVMSLSVMKIVKIHMDRRQQRSTHSQTYRRRFDDSLPEMEIRSPPRSPPREAFFLS